MPLDHSQGNDSRRSGRRLRTLWIAAAACLALAGCSRTFWRMQADRDVYHILNHRRLNPAWDVPRISVEPNPLSRFYDPYPPDCEPLPPDDPAAHVYMHCADGWSGYDWGKFGRVGEVENPFWLSGIQQVSPAPVPLDELPPEPMPPDQLPPPPADSEIVPAAFERERETDSEPSLETDADAVEAVAAETATIVPASALQYEVVEAGPYPPIEGLTLGRAIDLAVLHSREYQTQIENVYLVALALTFQRFQFGVRYLGGGGEPGTSLFYRQNPNAPDDFVSNSNFGVSQFLPTGGQWTIELLNNTIWLVSGNGPSTQTSTSSTLSYALVQPLLFGAGRDVVMAALTQAERDTLYALRILARFRKEFFVSIVSSGAGGGFLGLLERQQVILNQIDNNRRLVRQVERLRALASQKPQQISQTLETLPDGVQFPDELEGRGRYDADRGELQWRGAMSEGQAAILRELSDDPDYQQAVAELIERVRGETVTLDTAQLESQLTEARQSLRSQQASFANSVDQYKILLGLPTDMPVTINTDLLKQFQLIDPRLQDTEDRIIEFVEISGQLDDFDPDPGLLREVLQALQRLILFIDQSAVQVVRSDLQRVVEGLPSRLESLSTDEARAQVERNLERDRRLLRTNQENFALVAARVDTLLDRARQENLPVDERRRIVREAAEIREDLLALLQGLTVVQVNARVELIQLQPFDMSMETAVALALENRLDLMNQRAAVVDARRQVEVEANSLEAVVNVIAEGSLRTPTGTRPFDFRGDLNSFRAGFSFTAPLDQISERNDYRTALILYQRARRDYMMAEDGVKFDVRSAWRQLDVGRNNFEIARQAVRFAALQLDQAVLEGTAPVQPGERQASGSQGLNLLNALNAVLRAQNDLIGIWVDYERNRLNIYRDMGIMEIDSRGVWMDVFYQRETLANPTPTYGPADESAVAPVPQ